MKSTSNLCKVCQLCRPKSFKTRIDESVERAVFTALYTKPDLYMQCHSTLQVENIDAFVSKVFLPFDKAALSPCG